MSANGFTSVDELQTALGEHAYLADRGLSTAIYLSLSLGKPLLLEGEAGVGKTEVAKVLSSLLDRELIRLQCYEGIDASQALYEWNYSRQLIAVRAMDAADAETHVEDLFGPEFLVERPLLAALRAGDRAVLLVDELDRADDEFEAFLLEILSEFAVTIPEVGTRGRRDPARRDRDLEPHARAARRAEASLPLPLDRPPCPGARGRRSCGRGRRTWGSRSRATSPRRWRACASSTSRSSPAWPRRSTGRTRSRSWAPSALDVPTATDTLGTVVKDHEDQELVAARLADVVGGGCLRPPPPRADRSHR